MDIVFCADRRVLPGLHVAAYSVLDRFNTSIIHPKITIFSDSLDNADLDLLHQTLNKIGKPYSLSLHRINLSVFANFPPLNGSWATYYRLHAAQVIQAERFLYIDADTLCDLDVSELQFLDLGTYPMAWVPEAPLNHAADRNVVEQLHGEASDVYFNAGVMLVNTVAWREQRISERAIDYIIQNQPTFHDQSALNFILFRASLQLDPKFNCLSNIRKNWQFIRQPYGSIERLIHFIDYPKPWDLGSEWVHPQYKLWRNVLDKTAMKSYRSWHKTPARKLVISQKSLGGYQKAIKDRLLFICYQQGWVKTIKGISSL